jgi:hypothetical protein
VVKESEGFALGLVSDAVSVTLRDCSQFSQLMQQDFRSSSHFSQRTEFLATHLGLMLGDLPARIGISERMFYGYRSGKYPLTEKAWRKLEAAEEHSLPPNRSFRSEVGPPPFAPPSATSAPPSSDSSGTDPAMLAVLERIAIALEKLVEIGEGKNSVKNSQSEFKSQNTPTSK